MKIISLFQPYATLVVLGLKKFETRGWDTKYRGPLGIHATAGMPSWCKKLCYQAPFQRELTIAGYNLDNLPRGKIVGQVELINTQTTESWIQGRTNFMGYFLEYYWADEKAFGDYSPGRFAWELQNPVLFNNPIPAKGSQGFWNFDLPVLK